MIRTLLTLSLIILTLNTSICAATQGNVNMTAIVSASTSMTLSTTELDFGEIGVVKVPRDLVLNLSSNNPDGFNISISSANRGFLKLNPDTDLETERCPVRIKAIMENSDRYDSLTLNGESSKMNRFLAMRGHPDITIEARGTDLTPMINNSLTLTLRTTQRALAVGTYSDTLTITVSNL